MNENLQEDGQRFLKLATRLRRLGSDAPADKVAPISPSQRALLEYVDSSPGCGVKEIAGKLKLSPATVSISVRQLEKEAWLRRQPHPDDKRAIQLFIAPKGEAILEQSQAFYCQKFEQILSGLTIEERETLLTLLERAISAAEGCATQ